jgi:hypothetical protein
MSRSLASIACEKLKAEMTLRLVQELNSPGTLPPLPMPMPGNPEAGSTPGTAAPASELEFMLTAGLAL